MYCGFSDIRAHFYKIMSDHLPVMLREVVDLLTNHAHKNHVTSPHYLDCTFGGGGHSAAILEAEEKAHLLALDRDPAAQARAQALAERYGERFRFEKRNFAEIESIPHGGYQGILFDLGVSSYQLDEGARGFSFREDAPLDMRMDPTQGQSAAEFLESATPEALTRAIRDYGEEKRWRRVSDAIIRARGTGLLQRTASFSKLVADAVGGRPSRIHPATRTFQGIRIAVNAELEAIERALPVAFEKLTRYGVLAVISFHSLEDRIVKRFFKRMAGRPEHARDNAPQDTRVVRGTLLTRKALEAGEEELSVNPRSRSARLRAILKTEGDNQ